ncbi:AMP-binding protein [Amycolatopsis jejuensis]|uniref:AMP-binding protein n=1 Tax=Amycolatopsis jejuensis TaxID=330084 RepID=UPI0005276531|nr:AMP-binding protein [Amycolatopsis jejuensis]
MKTASTSTLRGLYADVLERFGDRTALVRDGRALSYRELAYQANQLANALHAKDVGPGDPVAVAMGNRAEFLVADQAIIRLGATKVPVNPVLTDREIGMILGDSGAKVAIADRACASAIQALSPNPVEQVIAVDEPSGADLSWADVLASADGTRPPEVDVDPASPALLIYTGGTTGRPKGVVHHQQGIVANLLAHVIEIGLLDDERMLLTTPLAHAAGSLAQAGLLKGATIHLEQRFDPGAVLDHLAQNRVTFTFMVPTMIYRLLDRLETRPADVSSLRTVLYGAAPILRERLRQGLERIGPVFMQLYGQTEAPNFITRLTREDHLRGGGTLLTSCGRPALLMDVVALGENGRPASPGTVGEIGVRGPYVMARYHNLPDITEEKLRDGWLHTGDIGFVDDHGYVHLLDRNGDVIISGGMNVYSAEVENVLHRCPGVSQVAVVGVADPDWGEAVTAVVVPDDNDSFSISEATRVCRAELAPYKRPKHYVQLDALPTTPYGKVDKRMLRTTVMSEGGCR